MTELPRWQNMMGKNTGAQVNNPEAQPGGGKVKLHGVPFSYNYLYVDGHVTFNKYNQNIGTGTLADPRGAWSRYQGD